MSTQDHQKQVHKKLHVSSFPLLPPNNACSSRDYNSNVSKLDFHYFAMDSFNKYRLSSLHLTMPKTNSKRSPLRHAVLLLIQDLKIQSYPNCCLNVNVTIFLHVLIRELVSLLKTLIVQLRLAVISGKMCLLIQQVVLLVCGLT